MPGPYAENPALNAATDFPLSRRYKSSAHAGHDPADSMRVIGTQRPPRSQTQGMMRAPQPQGPHPYSIEGHLHTYPVNKARNHSRNGTSYRQDRRAYETDTRAASNLQRELELLGQTLVVTDSQRVYNRVVASILRKYNITSTSSASRPARSRSPAREPRGRHDEVETVRRQRKASAFIYGRSRAGNAVMGKDVRHYNSSVVDLIVVARERPVRESITAEEFNHSRDRHMDQSEPGGYGPPKDVSTAFYWENANIEIQKNKNFDKCYHSGIFHEDMRMLRAGMDTSSPKASYPCRTLPSPGLSQSRELGRRNKRARDDEDEETQGVPPSRSYRLNSTFRGGYI